MFHSPCYCPSSITRSGQHHSYLVLCPQHKLLANNYVVVVPLWAARCLQSGNFWWFYSISAFLGGLPKNSLCHLDQNLFTMSCTHLHRFWVYKSGNSNLPGDGITTLDFIVNKLEGVKAKGLVMLLMVSIVSVLEFMTAYASAISVQRDSSSRLL